MARTGRRVGQGIGRIRARRDRRLGLVRPGTHGIDPLRNSSPAAFWSDSLMAVSLMAVSDASATIVGQNQRTSREGPGRSHASLLRLQEAAPDRPFVGAPLR